jgi:DNA anti-recombination protein RmuC
LNKDEIQKRIVDITNEMSNIKTAYGKLEGHLAESQHWLTQIIESEGKSRELMDHNLVGDDDS